MAWEIFNILFDLFFAIWGTIEFYKSKSVTSRALWGFYALIFIAFLSIDIDRLLNVIGG